jgi:hypothetical protein
MPATTDYLPSREADLVTWSLNFKTRITATPTAFGLVAAQATAYGTLHDAFVTAYNAANNDGTRTPSAIITKDDAKASLEANARLLARIVQATPTVTNTQKSDLGLTVRDVSPAPVPPPAYAPDLDVVSVSGRTVRIRLHDSVSSTRRGRPVGVAGASVFSFVGAAPPVALADWKFEGNTTRTIIDVVFDDATPNGAAIWLTACWYNPRAQTGPTCTPVTTNVPGGLPMAA